MAVTMRNWLLLPLVSRELHNEITLKQLIQINRMKSSITTYQLGYACACASSTKAWVLWYCQPMTSYMTCPPALPAALMSIPAAAAAALT
jgi:hypothetical protein